ncbi:MAG: mannose-6-phosphate isomerase, class I [Streptosporangiales bacterium]|nr:mannose-6-phosphate isomerase, class I [Streptosporangiales bacterium]
MVELANPVQPYPWGSRTVIAELLGEPVPAPGPQAELWLGAHPRAPSRVGGIALSEVIADDPGSTLGAAVTAEFGPRLPFLLKVLAADSPLSLQVHPSPAQAREGYAGEEAAGVPVDADHRNYRDDWPKPELICALTDFDGLCGFRDPESSRRLFELLVRHGARVLRPYADALEPGADLGALVARLLTADPAHADALVTEVARASASVSESGEADLAWAVDLAAAYPGDPGVVVALLLHHVRLAPGEALYLPAGNLHAYLHGAGVEVMAASDNVLRGGLTGKHIDVPELLRVLDARPVDVDVLRPRVDGAEAVYDTAARHFRLSCIDVSAEPVTLPGGGPQILLCVAGTAEVRAGDEHVTLRGGRAAFVGAATACAVLSGSGRVYRATVGHGVTLRSGNETGEGPDGAAAHGSVPPGRGN